MQPLGPVGVGTLAGAGRLVARRRGLGPSTALALGRSHDGDRGLAPVVWGGRGPGTGVVSAAASATTTALVVWVVTRRRAA